jgi:hypothetical protein
VFLNECRRYQASACSLAWAQHWTQYSGLQASYTPRGQPQRTPCARTASQQVLRCAHNGCCEGRAEGTPSFARICSEPGRRRRHRRLPPPLTSQPWSLLNWSAFLRASCLVQSTNTAMTEPAHPWQLRQASRPPALARMTLLPWQPFGRESGHRQRQGASSMWPSQRSSTGCSPRSSRPPAAAKARLYAG